jgi:antitoxin component YwqK of YwqJK toxin-antitoxin module
MSEETLDKVLKLIDSTNEMIKLRNEEIQLYHKLTRAVIGEKLLKDQKSKEIKPNELSEKNRNLLKEHNIKLGWPYGSSIKLYDSGAVQVLTSIKNVTTYVFIINDRVLLCPA